jgi:hypothetical protein
MGRRVTPNLGLVKEAGITRTASDNLDRLDLLGGTTNLLNDESVQFRAVQDIILQPADASIGGTPGQGNFSIGSADNKALTWKAYSVGPALFYAPSVGVQDPSSGYFAKLTYAPASAPSADRNFQLDLANGNRTLTLQRDLSVLAGIAGATGVGISLPSEGFTTLTAPATGTLVLTTLAQTLTSKSLDADQNTITNLTNANIKAAAAIDASKIADGSVSSTEFQYLNGVTSGIQAQLDAKQATGAYITALSGDVVAAGPGSAAATIQAGAITTAKILDGAVTYAKVNLAGSIQGSDIAALAGIAYSKLTLTGSVLDADIAASAAIAGTKVSPDFGSQVVQTSASFRVTNGAFYVGFQAPSLSASQLWTLPPADGTVGQVLTTDGAGVLTWSTVTGTGTVTSVALSLPAIFSVSGSPVTTSGTLSATLATQVANRVWAGPSTGADAAPTFRALVSDDLPSSIPLSKLAALSTARALVSDGSGFVSASATTASEVGYLSGVTSAIQTQLNGKQATGNYITALTGDIAASGPGSVAATIQSTAITGQTLVSAAAADQLLISDASDAGLLKRATVATITATLATTAKATWATADGTSKVVAHGLGTTDVLVQIFDIATGASIFVDQVVRTDANTVTLTASEAPPAGSWRVLILALA